MRILYVTDLHGVAWKYERTLQAAVEQHAEMVINGGDMLPATKNLRDQERFLSINLDALFREYDKAGIYHLSFLGNDDLRIFDELYEQVCDQHSHAVNIAQRKFDLGGFEFIGMNWVVDYPFRLKDRCRMDRRDYVFKRQLGTGLISSLSGWKEIEDWPEYARHLPTIEHELSRLPRPENMENAVFIIHMPPTSLGLDKCGHGEEVGSEAVSDFLREHQPLLSLHGHIHESPEATGIWKTYMGRTLCVQPGQTEDLTYVRIELPGLDLHCGRVKPECSRFFDSGKHPESSGVSGHLQRKP